MPADPIEQLITFRQKDKFAVKEWNARGLNPSNDDLCSALSGIFNNCADELIVAVRDGASRNKVQRILTGSLSSLKRISLDTEERGFASDLLEQLGEITGTNISFQLNSWSYGPVLASIFAVIKLFFPQRILTSLSQPCDICEVQLETRIFKKQVGISPMNFFIVKCNSCDSYNLVDLPPDIQSWKNVNYTMVESLSRNEFTKEQAQTRLEQIRLYRN